MFHATRKTSLPDAHSLHESCVSHLLHHQLGVEEIAGLHAGCELRGPASLQTGTCLLCVWLNAANEMGACVLDPKTQLLELFGEFGCQSF